MQLKLAALVTPDMVKVTQEIASRIEDLSIVLDVYHDPREALDLFHQYQEECDLFLFGGPIPFLLVQDYLRDNEIKLNKPMVYVPYTEIAIFRALFKLLQDPTRNHTGYPSSFSIDYPAESEIRECLDELGLSTEQIFTKACGPYQKIDELVSFHHELWSEKQVEVVMTSVFGVYQQLQKMGVPTLRISPSKASIRTTIHQALSEHQSKHQAESQIALGVIGLHPSTESAGGRLHSEYQLKRKKLALHQLMIDFGEEIQALVNWSENGDIRFITTRGQLEASTRHFQEITLLPHIQKQLNLSACLGIGFGRTAFEAEVKAYEALAKARSTGEKSSCFMVEMDGTVHGPIGERSQLKYSTRSEDPRILSLSKKAGLSVGTINKLLAFNEELTQQTFTAPGLAHGFGITLRSARRILSKLEESEIIAIIGEEQPLHRGRPRQMYKVNL